MRRLLLYVPIAALLQPSLVAHAQYYYPYGYGRPYYPPTYYAPPPPPPPPAYAYPGVPAPNYYYGPNNPYNCGTPDVPKPCTR
jgi:hypothetical protein